MINICIWLRILPPKSGLFEQKCKRLYNVLQNMRKIGLYDAECACGTLKSLKKHRKNLPFYIYICNCHMLKYNSYMVLLIQKCYMYQKEGEVTK